MKRIFNIAAIFGMISIGVWALSGTIISWRAISIQDVAQRAQQQDAAVAQFVKDLLALNDAKVKEVIAKYTGQK